ncbi:MULTISPECIES: bacterioferritin-associated ferredoxin [Uliginosibacterium]|nr:bacterioferritin-associated ferredoxin [Uliginosibacterium aquaticum]
MRTDRIIFQSITPPRTPGTAMYVCVCHAVTDRDIARAAADGARTVRDLRESLGVASSCGRCAQCAHACLKEASAAPHRTIPLLHVAGDGLGQREFATA